MIHWRGETHLPRRKKERRIRIQKKGDKQYKGNNQIHCMYFT